MYLEKHERLSGGTWSRMNPGEVLTSKIKAQKGPCFKETGFKKIPSFTPLHDIAVLKTQPRRDTGAYSS
jgi:hypothetical protein